MSVGLKPNVLSIIVQDDGGDELSPEFWHVVNKWAVGEKIETNKFIVQDGVTLQLPRKYQPTDYLSLDGKSKKMIQIARHLVDAWRNGRIEGVRPFPEPCRYPLLEKVELEALVQYAQGKNWDIPKYLRTSEARALVETVGVDALPYKSKELEMLLFIFHEEMSGFTDQGPKPDYDAIAQIIRERWITLYKNKPSESTVTRIMQVLKRDIDSLPGAKPRDSLS